MTVTWQLNTNNTSQDMGYPVFDSAITWEQSFQFHVHTKSGSHPIPYLMDPTRSFLKHTAARTRGWPSISVYCHGQECMELHFHSPYTSSWLVADAHLPSYLHKETVSSRNILVMPTDGDRQTQILRFTTVWPCIVTDSLWIKATDALNLNFIGIMTLHVSGSLSAHH